MEFNELSNEELRSVNGGSEASDSMWYYIGKGLHHFWNGLCSLDAVLITG